MPTENAFAAEKQVRPLVQPAWHVVSYPRSGNHIVRALMEMYSGRPTLGCPGSKKDTPIFERPPNQSRGLINITDCDPIGYKAHMICEILANSQTRAAPQKLLLITRNPADAISSHLARSHRRKGLMLRHRRIDREMVKASVDAYMGLVLFYQAFECAKIHVRFEDLVDPNWQLKSLQGLVEKVTGLTPKVAVDANQIMMLAKDSQKSLRGSLSALKKELSTAVSEFLEYDAVLKRLEG